MTIIAAIPEGQVASYGQIARLAGYPKRARQVGQCLARWGGDVPWYRVVNAAGRISHGDPESARRQAEHLRAEGVRVSEGRIDLSRYGWQPGPFAFA